MKVDSVSAVWTMCLPPVARIPFLYGLVRWRCGGNVVSQKSQRGKVLGKVWRWGGGGRVKPRQASDALEVDE